MTDAPIERTSSATRLGALPRYLFVDIDEKKSAAIAAGRDVIDFGIGDPDQPTPAFVIEAMHNALSNPAYFRYASSAGSPAFRGAAADYMRGRFGVTVDPERELIALLGSKEGIGHLPTAVADPGDVVLVPVPGYPVYESGSIFAGAEVVHVPMSAETRWLPDLGALGEDLLARTKLLYLNYPNNPTSACAPAGFFEACVALAREHGFLIAQDAAYAELSFEDPPPSILQVPGASDVAIEFHSLSKTFNMTGWRIGFAAGNADVIAALLKVKSNVDSGIFGAVQEAGVAALRGIKRPEVRGFVEIYRERRDALVAGLREAGWDVTPPPATFFLWTRCPDGWTSMEAAAHLLREADVVVIPGSGFGRSCEGYVRFSLTVPVDRIAEAVERIGRVSW